METREEAFIEKKELKMTVLPEFKKLFDSAGTIFKYDFVFTFDYQSEMESSMNLLKAQ